jgi:hypothetical protein
VEQIVDSNFGLSIEQAQHHCAVSGEAPMMAKHLDSRVLKHHDRQPADGRLRNRLIIGNVIAWIVVIILIRLIFF